MMARQRVAHARRAVAGAIALVALASCGRSPWGANAPAPPSAAMVELNAGVGEMGQFDFAAAREHFISASAMAETSEASLRRMALLNAAIARMNQTDADAQEQAIVEFGRAVSGSPSEASDAAAASDRVVADYCTALCHLYLGAPSTALPLLTACAQTRPGDAYCAYYLAQCAELTDAMDDALVGYERAAQLDPFLRSAQLGIQRVASRLNQPERAARALHEFERLAANPRSTVAEFKYTRMGPLGMCAFPSTGATAAAPPAAGVWASLTQLPIVGASEWSWSATGGHSVCAADWNGDGALDLLIPGALSTDAPNLMLLAKGDDFVRDPTHALSAIPDATACLAGDLDQDGLVDAVMLTATGVRAWMQADGSWKDATEAIGLSGLGGCRDAALADLDHDGDLDVAILDGAGLLRIFAWIDGGPMQEITDRLHGAAGKQACQIALGDIDGDRDVDILLVGSDGCTLWRNDRLWSWSRDAALVPVERVPAHAGAIFERATDGCPLIALQHAADGSPNASRAEVWQATTPANGSAWRGAWVSAADASAVPTGLPALAGGNKAFFVADLDGNRRTDVCAGDATTLHCADETGAPAWALGLPHPVSQWALVQLDASRGPSVLALRPGNAPSLLAPGGGRWRFATIESRGRIDPAQSMRSNASGIGTHLLARAGDGWSVATAFRPGAGPGQSLQPIALGLGGQSTADFLTIDWSDGVYQTELNIPSDRVTRVVETQRQLSSCPVIFGWNGSEYGFVTDCLGVGGVGYLLEPGVYSPPRPWERIVLGPASLEVIDGAYRIKLAEPMEESCWIDRALLLAYDLPAGWSMATDERMGITGPEPTGRSVFWRRELKPITAASTHESNVLAALSAVDSMAVEPGPLDQRLIGRLQNDCAVTLEFGQDLSALTGAWLVMDGWIEYPYCQTMFAAWQAHAAFRAPSLEARSASGEWVMVAPQFGYPAGMPRRSLLPLPALPAGCTALRLTTNHEIYWDRLAIALEEEQPVPAMECSLMDAVMARRGYAKRTTLAQHRPHYDDAAAVPLWDCREQVGSYTALGSCVPLVHATDDACAVFAGGEELELVFSALAPTEGASRHFVLDLDGWCKDMDLFTGDGETLAPWPMRGTERTPAAQRLHERFNTRLQGGR